MNGAHNLNRNCVIIEDSPVQAKVISSMMASNEWLTNHAANLSDGLKLIKEENPALVLLDLVLPDGVGEENVRKVKEICPDCIIISMSASNEVNVNSSMIAKSKLGGAGFILAKPFTNERLLSVLNEVDFRLRNNERMPHILVIDDSRSILAILKNIISQLGYRITLAESMNDALETVDIFDVDVIISDLNMPGIQPIDAIPEIRKQFPNVGIIAMSGNIDEKLKTTLFKGADAIIGKPFEIPKLLDALNIAFTRTQTLEEA